MDNYLNTGGVLPSGLLSGNDLMEKMAGFNKTYKNYPLRVGIVSQIYAYNDPNNFSKLSTEYDIQVFEQNEDRGSTILVYKNCIGVDGLGSIADFFEKNFRPMTVNNNPTGTLNTTYQNGSIVILMCLDGVSEKAVVIGGLNHPNRPTKLISAQPQLYGEYNGVAVSINPDGSTSLVFNGATDSYGKPTDPSQGITTVQIATDGSFSVQNAGVTMQLQKGGTVNITCTGPANIIAQGVTTIDGSHINLGQEALEAVIKGNTFAEIYNNHYHIGNLGFPTGVPNEPMDPSLSTHVSTE